MNTHMSDDIEYLKDMAESGTNAASLSGGFSTLWFGLLGIGLVTQWAILKDFIPVSPAMLGWLWGAVLLIGGIGSAVLGMSLKPGQSAAHNRLDSVVWIVSGIGFFIMAINIAVAIGMRDNLSPLLFQMIMPAAFLVYAANYAGRAALIKSPLKWLPVAISLASMGASILFVGTVDIFLVSAICVLAIWLSVGLPQLRELPKDTV